jgi:hypothetical protein
MYRRVLVNLGMEDFSTKIENTKIINIGLLYLRDTKGKSFKPFAQRKC